MSDERVARIEERQADQARTLESLAPLGVHLAGIDVKLTEVAHQLDRIETKRLDPLHVRVRRVEYAIVALIVAVGSPKVGGPSLPQVTAFFADRI